jgi:RNA-splicing ligase RtcB
VLRVDLGDLRVLGQGTELVPQEVEARVERGDVEQAELGGRVGFQGMLLGRSGSGGVGHAVGVSTTASCWLT